MLLKSYYLHIFVLIYIHTSFIKTAKTMPNTNELIFNYFFQPSFKECMNFNTRAKKIITLAIKTDI